MTNTEIDVFMFDAEEKFNTLIEKFFETIGFSVDCSIGLNFAYYPLSKEITYPLIDNTPKEANDAYKVFCKKQFNFDIDTYCNIFTFSLLHELGHYITFDTISKKKMRKIRKAKKYMSNYVCRKQSDFFDKQYVYCSLLDEKLATQTAINLILENQELIIAFENILSDMFTEFYFHIEF